MCQPERKVFFFAQRQRRRVHNFEIFTPTLTQVYLEGFQYIALAIVRQLISLAHVCIKRTLLISETNNVGATLASKHYLEKQRISLEVMLESEWLRLRSYSTE